MPDASATRSGTLWPLRPGGPLAVDGPGPQLPQLDALALPTPLWKQCVTFRHQLGRRAEARPLQGSGNNRSGSEQEAADALRVLLATPASTPWSLHSFWKADILGKGHLSPAGWVGQALGAIGVTCADKGPAKSPGRQCRHDRRACLDICDNGAQRTLGSCLPRESVFQTGTQNLSWWLSHQIDRYNYAHIFILDHPCKSISDETKKLSGHTNSASRWRPWPFYLCERSLWWLWAECLFRTSSGALLGWWSAQVQELFSVPIFPSAFSFVPQSSYAGSLCPWGPPRSGFLPPAVLLLWASSAWLSMTAHLPKSCCNEIQRVGVWIVPGSTRE